jgi:prepilin-type processing-associated H-X9-DG protein
MNEFTPKEITANRQTSELTIAWGDGHISVYPFSLLRDACPCVGCRSREESQTTESDPTKLLIPLFDARTTQIQELQTMGNYALNILWADGHSYGIYTWEYLRGLCPCETCQNLPQ